MNQRFALFFGGCIFAIVAVLHFLRSFYGVTVFIGGVEIANWVSWVVGIFAAAMALWMWKTAKDHSK